MGQCVAGERTHGGARPRVTARRHPRGAADVLGGSARLSRARSLPERRLLLDAGCSGDWSAVSGDPVKFGLGFSSMFFDTIFFVQHWVLYRPTVATRSGSAPLLVNVVAPAQEQGGGGGAVR